MLKVRSIHEKEPELSIGGGLTATIIAYARQGMAILEKNSLEKPQVKARKKT